MGNKALSAAHRRVIAEIVDVVIPSYPSLEAGARCAVQGDVNDFVMRQVAAIPSILRPPYLAALTVFDLVPLLCFGRRFVNLDRDRQTSYVDRWGGASLGVMRDVVKLVRSCALLAYFDHAIVRRQLLTLDEQDAR